MNAATSIERLNIADLIPYAANARTHSDEQVAQIAASIREFGFTNPVLIDAQGTIVAGHGRVMAARKLGMETVPCIRLGYLTPAQVRAYVIADNKLALNAGWDEELLAAEMEALKDMGVDLSMTGFSPGEIADLIGVSSEDDDRKEAEASLAERFGWTPFTVFNAREGAWQNRKQNWIRLGIRSEVGRGEGQATKHTTGGLTMKSWTSHPAFYAQKTAKERDLGKKLTTAEFIEHHFVPPQDAVSSGTSIFDPVLAELLVAWFSPPKGIVLDPFAGGSVRGVVSSRLGRQYVGVELRPEQVEANRAQAATICKDPIPAWHTGDSRRIDQICADLQADMLLSCPPYADLEVYSDRPEDISGMPYPKFLEVYREIIAKSCALLKPNSFAAWVIGEVRDARGNYYGFLRDTIEAFTDAGMHYYNEAVLVTPIGSLPIRTGRAFDTTRKLGKTHQNVLVFKKPAEEEACCDAFDEHGQLIPQHHSVLVFLKGDARAAAAKCEKPKLVEELMMAEEASAVAD
jgi:hypothetical protein